MNNLLSFFGLVDPRISASDKDLPVPKGQGIWMPKAAIFASLIRKIRRFQKGFGPIVAVSLRAE